MSLDDEDADDDDDDNETVEKKESGAGRSGFRRIMPMRYGGGSSKRVVNSQSTSLLFRLPFEIREMIYANLLTNFAIYPIKRSSTPPSNLLSPVPPAKMRHVRYKHNRDPRTRSPISMSTHGWIAHYLRDRERPPPVGFEGEGGSLVDVLVVCRRVYGEAVEMVYARNVFHFYYMEDLADFVASVPRRRAGRIAAVTMHYWAEMEWFRGTEGLVRGLGGLKRLDVKVEGPWGEEGGLVEMIQRVGEDVVVEVELRRCTKGLLRRLGECRRENLRVVNSTNVRLKEDGND